MKADVLPAIALVLSLSLSSGCTQNRTIAPEDASNTNSAFGKDASGESAKPQKAENKIDSASTQPLPAKITFDEFTFEKCAANEPHPEDYIFTRNGARIYTIDVAENETAELLRPKNIDEYQDPRLACTGDETSNQVIVERYSEEQKYCYAVYSLGDTVKLLGIHQSKEQIRLVNEGDGVWQFKTIAWNMTWGARPAAPELILKWNSKQKMFTPDCVAMQRRISRWNLARLKRINKQQFASLPRHPELVINNAPPELAEQIFEMCYSGRSDLARKFYNDCWPSHRPGKKRYWRFLMKEASRSDYWLPTMATSTTKRSSS